MSWTSGLKCAMPARPCKFPHVVKASRVALLGAASRLGAILALLLKRSRLVKKLELYDCSPRLHGYAADLTNVDTTCSVMARVGGRDALERAIQGCDIAVILQPKGMHESDPLRALNSCGRRVANYARVLCETNPRALVAMCCEPIEALVPVVSAVYCSGGWYDPGRIIGSCAISEVRCNTSLARCMGLDPYTLYVPIVGGVSGEALVPIFSKALPTVMLTELPGESRRFGTRWREKGTPHSKAFGLGVKRAFKSSLACERFDCCRRKACSKTRTRTGTVERQIEI